MVIYSIAEYSLWGLYKDYFPRSLGGQKLLAGMFCMCSDMAGQVPRGILDNPTLNPKPNTECQRCRPATALLVPLC